VPGFLFSARSIALPGAVKTPWMLLSLTLAGAAIPFFVFGNAAQGPFLGKTA
jgi:hypothetical protein